MRFRYSTTDPTHDESDSLPWLPLVLRVGTRTVEAVGLVDSGATVNVLPFELGMQRGAVWDDRKAVLHLSGSLGSQPAVPVFAMAEMDGLPATRLAFAWTKQSGVPFILAQTNFFMEFDVCFFRSNMEFESRNLGPESIARKCKHAITRRGQRYYDYVIRGPLELAPSV